MEELLADKEVDAVYVAVPNKFHAPLACQTLAAGKHVILDKPMALSHAQALQVAKAAEQSGKTFFLGMNQRFTEGAQQIRSLVEAGVLGEIYHAKAYWIRREGIHPHGGYRFGGSPDVVRHLLDLGGPRLGLCLDTAWIMQIGPKQGDPVSWAKEFAGRIFGVHYKDFTFERNGQWNDTVVGEGNLNLAAFVTALEEGGFDGMAVLEYEADPENPVPALRECVRRMRLLDH